jgi:hypothetical protein
MSSLMRLENDLKSVLSTLGFPDHCRSEVLGSFSKRIDPLASTALSQLIVTFALRLRSGQRLRG